MVCVPSRYPPGNRAALPFGQAYEFSELIRFFGLFLLTMRTIVHIC